MAETADAIIIGAGIMGSATAYHLTRRRYGRVVVLERDGICSGSTALASGGVRHQYANQVGIELTQQSIVVYENFKAEFGVDPQFRQNGYLILQQTEEERDVYVRSAAVQRAMGVDTRVLRPDEVRALCPYLRTEDLISATYSPRDGFADPYLATTAIAARARDLGASIKQQLLHFHRPRRSQSRVPETLLDAIARQLGDRLIAGRGAAVALQAHQRRRVARLRVALVQQLLEAGVDRLRQIKVRQQQPVVELQGDALVARGLQKDLQVLAHQRVGLAPESLGVLRGHGLQVRGLARHDPWLQVQDIAVVTFHAGRRNTLRPVLRLHLQQALGRVVARGNPGGRLAHGNSRATTGQHGSRRLHQANHGSSPGRRWCPQFYAGAREPAATGGEASAALGRPLVSAQDSASVRTPASAPVSPAPERCGP